MTSVLSVTPVGVDDYAGFELDGDQMFLLADGTVTHNCQLPPVKARWAFEAECWPKFAANTERLTKVWRQDQQEFLLALNAARRGDGPEAARVLTEAGMRWETSLDIEFDGTTIVPKNDAVDRYNGIALDRLPGKKIVVTSRRWGKQRGEWKQVPDRLGVKLGAYVMLLSNMPDGDGGFYYVNGDCGHITAYEEGARRFTVKLVRTGEPVVVYPLVRSLEQKDKPEGADPARVEGWLPREHNSKRGWVTGQVEYFPLRLAYASTVHRSQGLSLDRVQFDFRNHFAESPAMCYVSISRCRTKEGLRLVGQPEMFAKRCRVDPKIRPYL